MNMFTEFFVNLPNRPPADIPFPYPPVYVWNGTDRRMPDPRYLRLVQTSGEQAYRIRQLEAEIAALKGTNLAPLARVEMHLLRAEFEAELRFESVKSELNGGVCDDISDAMGAVRECIAAEVADEAAEVQE